MPGELFDIQIRYAANLREHFADFLPFFLKDLEVIAEQFDGKLSLYTGQRLIDVVFDILREVVIESGQLLELGPHLRDEAFFINNLTRLWIFGRPLIARRQINGDLDVVPTLGIGAVVGTAELGINLFGFREALEHLANPSLVGLPLVGGNRKRHRDREPDVSLIQPGQKFRAEMAAEDQGAGEQADSQPKRQRLMTQRVA